MNTSDSSNSDDSAAEPPSSLANMNHGAQKCETREQTLDRLLRELIWRVETVRAILLKDREKTDFDHAAHLLETDDIRDFLGLNKGVK
ncbi:MAG: hypothetical protein ACK4NR_12095 [Micavibrio sp.]